MSVNALSAANGADLLQRYSEATGQTPAAPATKTAAVLLTAKREAQLNEASAIAGNGPTVEAPLLDVQA